MSDPTAEMIRVTPRRRLAVGTGWSEMMSHFWCAVAFYDVLIEYRSAVCASAASPFAEMVGSTWPFVGRTPIFGTLGRRGDAFDIPTFSLDEFNFPLLDLLIADTSEVVLGSLETIRRCRPTIYVRSLAPRTELLLADCDYMLVSRHHIDGLFVEKK